MLKNNNIVLVSADRVKSISALTSGLDKYCPRYWLWVEEDNVNLLCQLRYMTNLRALYIKLPEKPFYNNNKLESICISSEVWQDAMVDREMWEIEVTEKDILLNTSILPILPIPLPQHLIRGEAIGEWRLKDFPKFSGLEKFQKLLLKPLKSIGALKFYLIELDKGVLETSEEIEDIKDLPAILCDAEMLRLFTYGLTILNGVGLTVNQKITISYEKFCGWYGVALNLYLGGISNEGLHFRVLVHPDEIEEQTFSSINSMLAGW